LVILCADVETQNSDVNKTSHGSGHYSGVFYGMSADHSRKISRYVRSQWLVDIYRSVVSNNIDNSSGL